MRAGPERRLEIPDGLLPGLYLVVQPITLTVYGPDGELAVPLLPKRALTLAQEFLARGHAGDQGGPVGHPATPLRSLCPLSC
jgi:hypothetical protein